MYVRGNESFALPDLACAIAPVPKNVTLRDENERVSQGVTICSIDLTASTRKRVEQLLQHIEKRKCKKHTKVMRSINLGNELFYATAVYL